MEVRAAHHDRESDCFAPARVRADASTSSSSGSSGTRSSSLRRRRRRKRQVKRNALAPCAGGSVELATFERDDRDGLRRIESRVAVQQRHRAPRDFAAHVAFVLRRPPPAARPGRATLRAGARFAPPLRAGATAAVRRWRAPQRARRARPALNRVPQRPGRSRRRPRSPSTAARALPTESAIARISSASLKQTPANFNSSRNAPPSTRRESVAGRDGSSASATTCADMTARAPAAMPAANGTNSRARSVAAPAARRGNARANRARSPRAPENA